MEEYNFVVQVSLKTCNASSISKILAKIVGNVGSSKLTAPAECDAISIYQPTCK
jgi:hypothetical protein